jgi:hypothetical protein
MKLFRDHVFHQDDYEGRPVLDLGHIITCSNKLDAGIDEKFQLVSRDEQSVSIKSYKDVKRGFEAAWADISKASNPARRRGGRFGGVGDGLDMDGGRNRNLQQSNIVSWPRAGALR